jgi:hypothetical protein
MAQSECSGMPWRNHVTKEKTHQLWRTQLRQVGCWDETVYIISWKYTHTSQLNSIATTAFRVSCAYDRHNATLALSPKTLMLH